MTTTPSTASQAPAVSILQDHEFMRALEAFADTFPCSGKEALIDLRKTSDYALVQIIDAKLAQAREREWKDIWAIADAELEEMQDKINHYADRATAAEAKLEAIRKEVRALLSGDDGDFVDRLKVSALLQPKPQADESGLTG